MSTKSGEPQGVPVLAMVIGPFCSGIGHNNRSQAYPSGRRNTSSAPESVLVAHPAQPPGFSSEQLAALTAPLDRANVRQREQGRSRVNYLEGWQVIAEANRIFGFDGRCC